MQNSYTNKIVLVTRGTSGIGRATALAFVEAGPKVVITGRREKEGTNVAGEITKTGAKYRGEIIPADALSVMDAETEALRASGIERRALKPGAVAPDFMLPDAQGRGARLQSLLRQGPVVLVFYRGSWCPLLQSAPAGLSTSPS